MIYNCCYLTLQISEAESLLMAFLIITHETKFRVVFWGENRGISLQWVVLSYWFFWELQCRTNLMDSGLLFGPPCV